MPRKIDRLKLNQLLRKGKLQKDIAEYFNVSRAAVSKAVKDLDIAVTRDVSAEAAPKVITRNLQTLAQLQKINDNANELLDLCMRWQRGDDEALQILESQVRKVRVGKTDKYIERMKFKDPRDIALKAMAEIRNQLALQLSIFESLYNLQAAADFQTEVLDVIGSIDKDARNRIIKKLAEKTALRRIVSRTG